MGPRTPVVSAARRQGAEGHHRIDDLPRAEGPRRARATTTSPNPGTDGDGDSNASAPTTKLWFGPQESVQDQGSAQQPSKKKSALQQLLEEARKNGGRLKIDRKRLLELNAGLGKRMNQLSPVGGRINDAWAVRFRNAFADYADHYADSMFPVMVTGRVSALAVAVSQRRTSRDESKRDRREKVSDRGS